MNDDDKSTITPLNEEELDYLYSLYKSSQSGSGAVLSKEELKKLIESGRINVKPQQLDENNIKKGAVFNFQPMSDISNIHNVRLVIQEMLENLEG